LSTGSLGPMRMPPLSYPGRVAGAPPAWNELAAPFASIRLKRSLVWRGLGVPPGRGQPVLLIPGFMGGDGSMALMRRWLATVGYRPEPSGLVFNVRHSEAVMRDLEDRLAALQVGTGHRVALVGHSRGGLLAKVLAQRHPTLVSQVIGLGAPLANPFDVHPLTMLAVRLAQVYNLSRYRQGSEAEGRFLRDLAAPSTVPLTSIYSRSDGIVHWQACLRPDADCIEIDSSHNGFPLSPDAYVLLGQILARRP
jgi:triacylglycerol lipase